MSVFSEHCMHMTECMRLSDTSCAFWLGAASTVSALTLTSTLSPDPRMVSAYRAHFYTAANPITQATTIPASSAKSTS